MNAKKIIVTTENDEEIEFIPKFPVQVSLHKGISETTGNYGISQYSHNGYEVLIIISAPDFVLNEIFPKNYVIEKLINTK